MERSFNLDKAPRPQEVMLPHRSDGIAYALRRAYPAAASNCNEFDALLSQLNAVRVNGRCG